MALLAKNIMTSPVVSVRADLSLKDAAEILDNHHFSGLPVVDEGENLVGIISETDFWRYTQQIIGQPLRDPHRVFTGSKEVLHFDITHRGVEIIELVASTTVEKLMTMEVIFVTEETPLYEVVHLMHKHDINRVPVVDKDHKLRGIITRADIIKAVTDNWGSIE